MKENIYDSTVNKIMDRVDKVSESLATQFKGVKPFAKEPIPKNEMLRAYQSLTPDDMNWLIVTHGQDRMNSFIAEMEMERQKQLKKIADKEWANGRPNNSTI